jgi:hypothetical protein
MLAFVFAYVTLPAASAQATDSGYPDELSPSLAGGAKAMHAMIRRDLAETAENMTIRSSIATGCTQRPPTLTSFSRYRLRMLLARGRPIPSGAPCYNIAHNNEHYGNLAVYMRLKGLVPPSTAQQRKN